MPNQIKDQAQTKTMLITGFEPFGGQNINPSWMTVTSLPDEVHGCRIVRRKLPVIFGKAAESVIHAIEEIHPDYVILLGQAGGRSKVTPELQAVNFRSVLNGSKGSNVLSPENQKIIVGGPDKLKTSLPIKEAVAQMQRGGYLVDVSESAGTFVCNDTFYLTLYALKGTDILCDFIHVPYLPEQTNESNPSMPLQEIVDTVEQLIEVFLDNSSN